ncbi:uncharacterized protein KY384_003345 [Bacidia gigantensis]|uniref:uncharacterized protein n=1 Tax=Bacidia gigantensis TaxID=2732470 RepID=UPI001D039C33|nr:uncharacterized protein KY384_003345 [Bacidia gigantensis]KAG8531713.1 hypothetical protein KY384_003345 [Bacidia gigantensis]
MDCQEIDHGDPSTIEAAAVSKNDVGPRSFRLDDGSHTPIIEELSTALDAMILSVAKKDRHVAEVQDSLVAHHIAIKEHRHRILEARSVISAHQGAIAENKNYIKEAEASRNKTAARTELGTAFSMQETYQTIERASSAAIAESRRRIFEADDVVLAHQAAIAENGRRIIELEKARVDVIHERRRKKNEVADTRSLMVRCQRDLGVTKAAKSRATTSYGVSLRPQSEANVSFLPI